MDRSLDDIIKDNQSQRKAERKSGNNNAGANSGGKARSRTGREDRKVKPYSSNKGNETAIRQPFPHKQQEGARGQGSHRLVQPNASHFQHVNTDVPNLAAIAPAGLSIFERLGDKKSTSNPAVSGTSVTISNLNADITIADLSELCGTIGEVKSVDMDMVSRPGAKKTGRVLFARRSDALTCVTKFNGLTLDGTKMSIQLTGEGGKPNPFNPVDPEEEALQAAAINNKKASLFGSALDEDDVEFSDNHHLHPHQSQKTKFVTKAHATGSALKQPFQQRERRPSHDGHDDRVASGRTVNQQRQGKPEGGRGRGGRISREEKKPVTTDDLDADMDAYFAAK